MTSSSTTVMLPSSPRTQSSQHLMKMNSSSPRRKAVSTDSKMNSTSLPSLHETEVSTIPSLSCHKRTIWKSKRFYRKKQPLIYAQAYKIALHSVSLSKRLFQPSNNMIQGTGRVRNTYIVPLNSEGLYTETAPRLVISADLGVLNVH